MAGPRVKFAVPFACFNTIMSGCATSRAMPMSTANAFAPAAAAIRLTLAAPSATDCATSAVTSLPDCDTPSSTTP